MPENELITTCSFARTPNLISSNIDNEIVILSIDSGHYYNLNAIASEIWNFLDVPHSFTEIIEYLIANYNTDKETCQLDTIHFLKELLSEGIIYKA